MPRILFLEGMDFRLWILFYYQGSLRDMVHGFGGSQKKNFLGECKMSIFRGIDPQIPLPPPRWYPEVTVGSGKIDLAKVQLKVWMMSM